MVMEHGATAESDATVLFFYKKHYLFDYK
jgi:hypothetical protein